MKIITLWQPWATLLVLGYKRYETRHWATKYRGKLLIHAAKRPVVDVELDLIADKSASFSFERLQSIDYPLGAVVGQVELVDCLEMSDVNLASDTIFIDDIWQDEKAFGLWLPERFAWECKKPVAFKNSILWKGSQGLKQAPEQLIELVESQVSR